MALTRHRVRPLRTQEELFGWVVPLAGSLVPVAEAGARGAAEPHALMVAGVQLAPAGMAATPQSLPHLTPGGGMVASRAEIIASAASSPAPAHAGVVPPAGTPWLAHPAAGAAMPAVLLHAASGGGTVSASIARDGGAATVVSGTAMPNGPSVATLGATGQEDTVIALRIAASDRSGHADGVVLEIRGLPPGASLTAGHMGPDGAWEVPGNAVIGLGLRPGANWFGTGALQITARQPDGQQAVASLGFRITPVADTARIDGTDHGAVREDLLLSASGKLHVTDPDPGEAHFIPGDQAGHYGHLALTSDGHWKYQLDTNAADVQALTSAGHPLLDRFTVHSADGTPHAIQVTIIGQDDRAVITGIAAGAVQEDVAVGAGGQLATQGRLLVADPDAGQAVFQPGLLHGLYGGTLQIDADGHWHYGIGNAAAAVQGLPAGQAIAETFTVSSADGTTHRITVTVNGTNDAPVLAGQTQSTTEDGTRLTGQMVASDVDSGDTQAFSTGAQVPGFTLNPDGSYSFDPADTAYQHLAAGQTQSIAIPVTVTDSTGATATQTLTLTITGTNDAPVLVAQTGSTTEDGTRLTGHMVATDIDSGDTQAFSTSAQVPGFTLNPDGSYSFDPADTAYQHLAAGQTQSIAIPVTVTDSTGATATQTLTLTITGTNDAPVLAAQTGSATEDGTRLTGHMVATDIDSGDTQAFSTGAQVPGFTLNPDGSYSFDPGDTAYQHLAAGQTQSIAIPVTVTDSTGATATQTLTLTITGTNDAAVITGTATGTVQEDSAVSAAGRIEASGQLAAADADTGESRFVAQGAVAGTYGTLSIDATGHWTYSADNSQQAIQDLNTGEHRIDRFEVHSADGTAHQIAITLQGLDDKVRISGVVAGAVTEDSDPTFAGKLELTGGPNPASHHLGDHILAGQYGQVDLRDDGRWFYTLDNLAPAVQALAAGETLTDRVTVTAPDGATQELSVTIRGSHDLPVIAVQGGAAPAITAVTQVATPTGATDLSDFATGHIGVPVGAQLMALYAPGSDVNLLAAIPQADRPTVFNGYTAAGVSGYSYFDQHGWFGAHVRTAAGLDTAPQPPNVRNNWDGGLAVFSDGTVAQIQKVCDGSGNEKDYIYFSKYVALNAAHGGTEVAGRAAPGATVELHADGAVVATVTADAQGAWAVGIPALADGDHTVSAVIAGQATPPQVFHVAGTLVEERADTLSVGRVAEGTATASLSGQLVVTDVDATDAPSFTAQAGTAGQYGQFSIDAQGHWTYAVDNTNPAVRALAAGETRTETFTVQVTTQSGEQVARTLSVTVLGTDAAPVLTAQTQSTTEDSARLTGHMVATDIDTGDTLAFSTTAHVAGFTLNPDGSYSLDPAHAAYQHLTAGQVQTITIPVTVTDKAGATASQTLTLTLTGTNDAPVLTAKTAAATEDSAVLTGRMVATDADTGDTQAFSTTAHVDGFTLNADGSYSFDPTHAAYQHLGAGQVQTLAIPVTVADSTGATVTQTLTITVTGSNDAPTATLTADLGSVAEDGGGRTFTQADLLHLVGAADTDSADTLHITGIAVDARYGSFTQLPGGDWTFTPAHNAHHADIPLTLSISDGHATTQAHGTLDIASVTDAPAPRLIVMAQQQVMTLGPSGTGAVVQTDTLHVGHALSALTVDMTILGGQQVATQGAHGATLFSYGTPSDPNHVYIWNPDNLTFRVGGQEYQTGIRLAGDGHDHRYSFIWNGTAGTLDVLLDGKSQAHLTGIGQGATIQDGGKFVLAQDQDSFGGGFAPQDAYSGKLFDTAIAAEAVDPARLAQSPLRTVLHGSANLLVALQAQGGGVVDTTGHYHFGTQGDLRIDTVDVDTAVATPNPGATLKLAITQGAPDDADDPITATRLSGFTAGTVLSDGGGHSVTVTGPSQAVDVQGWQLAGLTAQLPSGSVANLNIHLAVHATGPDGQVAIARTDVPVVLDRTQPVPPGQASAAHTGPYHAPVIAAQSDTATEDGTATTGHLAATDADAGDTLAFSTTAKVDGFTLNADGSYRFDPAHAAYQHLAAGQVQTIAIPVTVTDSDGLSASQTLTFTLTGTDDAPVLTATTAAATEDGAILKGQLSATDVDTGDRLAYATTAQVDGFTLNADGSYSFDPTQPAYQHLGLGQVQTIAIPVTVTDGSGATATQTLTIALTGSNDAPTATATADLGRVAEDGTQRFTEADLLRLAGAADTDTADALHVTGITVDAQYGHFAREANGDWVFTPAPNAHHAGIPLTLSVSDGHATATAHATLDVTPVTDAASASLAISAEQQVLDTGTAAAPGRIVVDNLQAGAPLQEMTMEFTVIGQAAGSGSGSQGPVILNFGSHSDNNMLSLWNPANMKIGGAGDQATGINLADGHSHRITLTWSATTGQLKVFDNGHLTATIDNYHKGGTLPADGFMVLGQKWNNPGNTANPGWSATEHYEGKIFNAAVGSRALSDDQVARAPLASQMHAGTGLLIDVRSVNGQLVDTAHGHAMAPEGIVIGTAQVDTTLTPPPPGALLHLQASFTAPADTDDHVHAVMLSGLPDGTVVSDGHHSATVAHGQPGIDVDGWNLSGLTAQLPASFAGNTNIALTVTTEGPDGTLAHAHADTALVMDPLSPAPLPPPPPPAPAAPPADDHVAHADLATPADPLHHDPAPAPDHPAIDHPAIDHPATDHPATDHAAQQAAPGDLAHYLDAVAGGDPASHPAPDHAPHDAASYLDAIGAPDIPPPPHEPIPPPDLAGHDAAHTLDPTPVPDPVDHTDHAALIPVPIPEEEHHQQVHV